MIEMTAPKKDAQLSIGVRCPVCIDLVLLSFVSGKDGRSDFYSPSNFHRHLVRHTKAKPERVTSLSKASVRVKREAKYKPSGKRQRTTGTSSDDSEDSSERVENVRLEKELADNYVKESDDFSKEDSDVNDLVVEKRASKGDAEAGSVVAPGPSKKQKNIR